jgi:hypothetical protein
MTYVIFIYFFPQNNTASEPTLIIPCEVAVKSVIPAVKALMAKDLVEKHGFRQDQVAGILGISQSAVSRYQSMTRGQAIKVKDIQQIQPIIDNLIEILIGKTYPREELLNTFCQACVVIRRTRLMCQLCRKSDSDIEITECTFCLQL